MIQKWQVPFWLYESVLLGLPFLRVPLFLLCHGKLKEHHNSGGPNPKNQTNPINHLNKKQQKWNSVIPKTASRSSRQVFMPVPLFTQLFSDPGKKREPFLGRGPLLVGQPPPPPPKKRRERTQKERRNRVPKTLPEVEARHLAGEDALQASGANSGASFGRRSGRRRQKIPAPRFMPSPY